MGSPRGLGLREVDWTDGGSCGRWTGCLLFALLVGYAGVGALLVWLVWQVAGWLIRLAGG